MHQTQGHEHPSSSLKAQTHHSPFLDISRCYSSSQSDKNSTLNTHHRKLSSHELTAQVQQFELRGKSARKSLKISQLYQKIESSSIPTQVIDQKDVFQKSKLYDQLQFHYNNLKEQSQPLQQEEVESMDYVTFRMVKQTQKTHLNQLRKKIFPFKKEQLL